MNRIIKFRAWDDGKMIYQTNALSDLRKFFRVIREDAILMQFTGLTDLNSVEIYEGDVVKYKQSKRFGESVSECTTAVKYDEYGFTPMMYNKYCEDEFYSCIISDISVIGNIYENSNLLEK